jgi:RNA polymerase sigma-70 factor (ECF subfamily)
LTVTVASPTLPSLVARSRAVPAARARITTCPPNAPVILRTVVSVENHEIGRLVSRPPAASRSSARGSREDAEDVLQETFLRAYRALGRCDDPERFGAWLFGILVNRCRTAGARATRLRRLFSRDPAPLERASAPSDVERDEWDEVVRWALARLPPAYREAFLLKHAEELEYEQMAQLTGLGVSALKMRVKRARERLQAMLSEVERV